MKKIIGIVPPAKLFEEEIPHRDLFLFGNPYVQRIEKQNAVPIGILSADGYANADALSLCDGFLLAGGNKIWPYHLQVIDYALHGRRPLLGICLGMQAIAAYFHVQARMWEKGGDLLSTFEEMKKARFMFNVPVADHYLENVTRASASRSRHPVTIHAGTRLYDAVGTTHRDAVSLHSYQITPPSEALQISATAQDGTIEGVEYGGYLVGVQFHPEVEDAWDGLFAAFIGGGWKATEK